MNVIVVDDEPIILQGEMNIIQACEQVTEIYGFLTASEAIRFAEENRIDIAFLDSEIPGIGGSALAKKLKALQPCVNVIFATAYGEYTDVAMKMHASGYILKPMRREQVLAELQDLRYPVSVDNNRLFFRTFGEFEVFFQGSPVLFRYQKSKEMLACLVDRAGDLIASTELMSILWPDEDNKGSYLKQVRKDVLDTFEKLGVRSAIIKQRGYIGIVTKEVSCDYFDWLKGLPAGINAFQGSYMNQYPWARETLDRIRSTQ